MSSDVIETQHHDDGECVHTQQRDDGVVGCCERWCVGGGYDFKYENQASWSKKVT